MAQGNVAESPKFYVFVILFLHIHVSLGSSLKRWTRHSIQIPMADKSRSRSHGRDEVAAERYLQHSVLGLIPVQGPEANLLWDSLMFRVLGRNLAGNGAVHPRAGRARRRCKVIPARVCWHEDAAYANREKKPRARIFCAFCLCMGI